MDARDRGIIFCTVMVKEGQVMDARDRGIIFCTVMIVAIIVGVLLNRLTRRPPSDPDE